jgi:nicotinamidase-related amidase
MQSRKSSTALLVIDMQDAVRRDCVNVLGVIERINDLLRRAREVGAAVVFIQHEDASDAEMAAGSAGWRLADALERLDGDMVVAKTYRDSFAGTELADVLTKVGARRIVLTGAQSDFCVQTTALSALFCCYDLTLVSDAHTTSSTPTPKGELAAETILAFVNSRVATMRHPGRIIEVLPASDILI